MKDVYGAGIKDKVNYIDQINDIDDVNDINNVNDVDGLNYTDDANKCLTLSVEFDNIVSRYIRREKARG